MKTRPDSCPNCGAPCRHHTGTYCHECGTPLVAQRPLPRTGGVKSSVAFTEAELAAAVDPHVDDEGHELP